MKGKFLNTKNVVIGLVSLVLIGASATGVTVFLKNRGRSSQLHKKKIKFKIYQQQETTNQDNNQGQTQF